MKRNLTTTALVFLLIAAQTILVFSQNNGSFITYRTEEASASLTHATSIKDSVTGIVFQDLNTNGVHDNGESVYNGVTVNLYVDANGNGVLDGNEMDSIVATTTTVNGLYGFEVNPILVPGAPAGVRVSNDGANDATQATNTNVNVTNAKIEFKSSLPYAGFRFQNLNIPKGSVITSAYIEFTATDDRNQPMNMELSIQNNVNPAIFTTDQNNISNRWNASNVVAWNNVAAWVKENVYQTPEVKSLIQSVVDRTDWEGGKDIVLMTRYVSGNERKAYSYDGDVNKAPRLVVNYSAPQYPAYYIARVDESTLPCNCSFVNGNGRSASFSNPNQTQSGRDFGVEENGTLPVELTFFQVEANGSNAILTWETASEVNNDYFSVQRSENAIHWEEIGIVEGHGNSTEVNTYSFEDKGLASGKFYYRLQQIDFDGTSDFSGIEVVSIVSGKVAEQTISIYPNPARLTGTLTIEGLGDVNAVVNMYSTNGSHTATIQLNGNGTMDLSTMNLENGIYIVQVTANDVVNSFKLVVQK